MVEKAIDKEKSNSKEGMDSSDSISKTKNGTADPKPNLPDEAENRSPSQESSFYSCSLGSPPLVTYDANGKKLDYCSKEGIVIPIPEKTGQRSLAKKKEKSAKIEKIIEKQDLESTSFYCRSSEKFDQSYVCSKSKKFTR